MPLLAEAPVPNAKDLTMSGELRSLNFAGKTKEIFYLLNTQMGEGIAVGLVCSCLLAAKKSHKVGRTQAIW